MSEPTTIDCEELRRRINQIEADVYRNTDRRDVDDMALLQAALLGADVDPDDVVIITDEDGNPATPLEEAVETTEDRLDRKSELATVAATLAPALRDHGYDSVEISSMTDDEICRTFTREVEKIQANDS